jgi:hypothetical protein
MRRFREDVEGDFLAAYSDYFLQDALRILATSYRGAHADCRVQFPAPEAHDLYPIMRRAMIEYQIRELAKSYPEISASAQPNHGGTSYYTLLSSGNVFLTANAVDHPNKTVRKAMFRETYARASQPNLFGEPPEEGTILYGILLHGPDELNKTRPEFAHIAFPNKDCSDYVGRVDLFGRFPGLVSELWSVDEEVIPDELDMGIRPESERRKEGEEEAEDHTG